MAQFIDILDAAIFLLPVAIAAGFALKLAFGVVRQRAAH
jgi:hypothetical protein